MMPLQRNVYSMSNTINRYPDLPCSFRFSQQARYIGGSLLYVQIYLKQLYVTFKTDTVID